MWISAGGGQSPGNNVLRGNEPWDLVNLTERPIMARHNTWTHASRADIDRYDIYDNDEDARHGAVSFEPAWQPINFTLEEQTMEPQGASR